MQEFCEGILTRFSANEDKKVLIASHGGLIKLLLAHLVEDEGCEMPEDSNYKYCTVRMSV